MKQIIDTLSRLAKLDPPELPKLELPALPDLRALAPLAKAMNADARPITDVLTIHDDQRESINRLFATAGPLIDGTHRDLFGIGNDLLAKATPIAAGMLSLDPTTAATAQVQLTRLANEAAATALERVGRLESELASVITGFDDITAAADPNLSTIPQMQASISDAGVTPTSATSEQGAGSGAGQAAVNAALSQIGTPYVWGGTGNGGFDCSGLTQWAYRQAGIELPRLAHEQAIGQQVSADDLQPGDLAVWDGHVAMYTGDGMLVEAGDPVQQNPVRTSNMGMGFRGFWRPTA